MRNAILKSLQALNDAQAALHEALALLDAPTPDEAPVSVAEAAEMLGLSEYQTRHKLNAGEIRARKVGRSWRVLPSDVKAYLRGDS